MDKNKKSISLLDLAGILTHEEAEKMRKIIAISRKNSQKRMIRIRKEMNKIT